MCSKHKSPISRIGGKFYLAGKITSLFPDHECYVEPFGGAMHVLFRKEPSAVEVYNDIDGDLVNFFRQVKNHGEQMIDKLEYVLYSRQEFDDAKTLLSAEQGNPIDRAVAFYIVNRQCFGGTTKNQAWGYDKALNSKRRSYAPRRWFKFKERLEMAMERLRNVQIENRDYIQVINAFDSADTLFYLDPPYIFNENRGSSKLYHDEMALGDHEELVEILDNISGKFILSGYENDVYSRFNKTPIGEAAIAVAKIQNGGRRTKQGEFVWCNF